MKRFLLVAVVSLVLVGAVVIMLSGPGSLCWIVLSIAESLGLESKVDLPERPLSVPANAVWAGGADGGAWIECFVDEEKDANWCTVWNDSTGEVWARTFFVTRSAGEVVPEEQLSYQSFDGVWIRLFDGRILEPLAFHGKKPGSWAETPIEPLRE